MRILAYGPTAALVELETSGQAADLAAWAARGAIPAREVVPGARTVLFDGVDPATLDLSGWRRGSMAPQSTAPVRVPVTYDGPDLATVADLWGCSIAEVIAEHTATAFVSAFCGFAPGFAYLSGLPDSRAVPRLDNPRVRVPAGSVALADTWCGIYPTSSPGGWRVIGRTDLVLWDSARTSPATLAPGTEVRFVDVGP